MSLEAREDATPQESRSVLAERLRRRRSKRSLLDRVSIQSKLMLMLLTMSVLATAIAGGIGFQSGRSSLREAVFDRLTGIREAQARVLEMGLKDLSNSLVIDAKGEMVSGALAAFNAAFTELRDAPVDPAQNKAITDYYATRFRAAEDGRLDTNALVPISNAAKYLQSRYTVAFPDEQKALAVDDAKDGSAWSAANARYNPYFREIVSRLGFRDAMLINAKGDVVYSALKGVELGQNVITGPYRGEGALPEAFRRAMATNEIDYVDSTDFGEYLPSGEPTAWMLVAIGPPGRAAGVFAVEYPASVVNNLMTADRQWERAGMGQTGEAFVVGKDDLMRSDSRLFLEDPQAYRTDVIAAGTSPEVADQAIKQGTTVLVQPVGTKATQAAQRGETGTLIATDYLGHRALQAYAPLNLKGLDWVVVASLDSDEAFAPERNFAHRLVRAAALIIFIACLAAMLWAKLFVRPIKRLEEGAEQISTGDYNVRLPVNSGDEFGDLTVAFNDMSRNLAVKDELLTKQREENDRLLLSLMPEAVVERYRDGEENIAAEHQDVTVIFADLGGLDEMSARLEAEESLEVINKLVRQFDAAADTHGVERVRNTHNGYLASCGLTVPRLDNIHRTVDFAIEMQRIVDRFNAESGHNIALRAGIDTGAVTSGLVGRAGLVYDLWGGAVHLASKMRRGSAPPGIYVSEDVYEATRDTLRYTPAGTVQVGDQQEPTWRLAEDRK
ncbi:adenylate/guanylate cyclase domain-containing protein [Mycolicibacterium sp.]|uniref:adenylate/guanylate cyclase domain-containing protein n=1 Tax=Mycolicibacterium sp. TaxID=2320850 RepID=UPI0028B01F6D|nr:adenylate/guanylate cyclase domain-containing protein [Mycolicibacterium sp.]